jgi:exonuclease III
VLASPAADRRITDAFIWDQVTGSDHCPVGVELLPG